MARSNVTPGTDDATELRIQTARHGAFGGKGHTEAYSFFTRTQSAKDRTMNSFRLLSTLAIGALLSGHVAAGPNVSVTIDGQIQPGVYGRVEIGNVPPPPIVYARPVVIVRPPPRQVVVEPLYLHVPPGHARNWRKHCRKYAACGQPVYFVRSAEYEPGYRRKHRHDDDRGQGRGRGHSRD